LHLFLAEKPQILRRKRRLLIIHLQNQSQKQSRQERRLKLPNQKISNSKPKLFQFTIQIMASFESFLSQFKNVKVIEPSISYDKYIEIDLSDKNQDLNNELLANPSDLEVYIKNYLNKNNALVAFGGYYEIRNLYKRSTIFNGEDFDERNIHIGLDLWTKENTEVNAALDGIVHSYNFNNAPGDYGPTVILEHLFEEEKFYTLYGHLSLESIANLQIGDQFKKGVKIGNLGNSDVNGGYSPHLHFQIIKNLDQNFGDYPGVCSKNKLSYYLENCPDPNLLLKLK
jgi:murein DD-endopeptidase MepM/ murein hydrolase activator NlpD